MHVQLLKPIRAILLFSVNREKEAGSKYFYHLTGRIKMSNKPVKIFLVEDDLSFGSVLKSYLEINDYSVEWVDDGKYALDHFRKGSLISAFLILCFLMLMDLQLPMR